MKKALLLVLMLFLLSLGNAFAYSFPLYNSGITGVAGTQFEDDDLDYHLDLDGNNLISEGDVLIAAVEFTAVLDLFGGTPSYTLDKSIDELVALSIIEVDTIIGNQWTFKEWDTNFLTTNNSMIQVYSGGPTNLDLLTAGADPTLGDAISAITDGTHLWDFSITADLDTYWSFTTLLAGADNPSTVAGLPSVTKLGVANYQLNQTWGDDIFDPIFGAVQNDDGLIDLIGSADILGGLGLRYAGYDSQNPLNIYAFARSDADAAVNPIPEPSTLLLLGTGFLGLAFTIRKRNRNS